MSDEKGVIDTLMAVGAAALAYMGYMEARMRSISVRREKQSQDITRLQEQTCTTEEVRAIIKDEMSETKGDVKDIYSIVNDIKVSVGRIIR